MREIIVEGCNALTGMLQCQGTIFGHLLDDTRLLKLALALVFEAHSFTLPCLTEHILGLTTLATTGELALDAVMATKLHVICSQKCGCEKSAMEGNMGLLVPLPAMPSVVNHMQHSAAITGVLQVNQVNGYLHLFDTGRNKPGSGHSLLREGRRRGEKRAHMRERALATSI